MSPCDRVDDAIADVLDGTAPEAVIAHLATCDRCRDVRHETTRALMSIEDASVDFVPRSDLAERLLASVEARAEAPRVSPLPAIEERAPANDRKARRRTKPIVLVTPVALVIAAVVAFLVARQKAVTANGSYTGTIALVERAAKEPEGGVQLCKDACRPAKAGDAVAEGERVLTDARTRLRLDLSDGSKLVLDRDTELSLSREPRTARLVRGVLSADIAHLETKAGVVPPRAQFFVPHGSIEVVGTRFILTAAEDMSLVEVVEGEVSLRDRGRTSVPVHAGSDGRLMTTGLPIVSQSRGERGEMLSVGADEGEAAPRGIGELKARKPGETVDRDRAVHLARHAVKIRISGNVARTEIDETFANDTDDTLEGIYRMPLPADAQIERLALEVDGKLEEGAFVERSKAKAIWNGAIQNAAPKKQAEPDIIWVPGPWRDPALLEWQRGGRFELRIFPIPPKNVQGGARRVVLAYTQTIERKGGLRRYTYPLAYDRGGSTTIDELEIDAQVVGHDPIVGVKTRGYALTRSANESKDDVERLRLAARGFVPAGSLALEYAVASDDAEVTSVAYLTDDPNEDAYVTLAIRPRLPAFEERVDHIHAIVVDSSRSMIGERWKRASAIASTFVRDADARDRVAVLACDTQCRPLVHGAIAPGAASSEEVAKALVETEPQGAHDPLAAIHSALELVAPTSAGKRVNVVYLGDGGASSGSSRAERLGTLATQETQPRAASITTIGVGSDADSTILRALARGGGGAFVPDAGQSTHVIATSALALTRGRALVRPVLTPTGLQKIAPAHLDTVVAGGEIIVTGRLARGSGQRTDSLTASMELEGFVGGERYRQVYPLEIRASGGASNAFVPRLHAALRIADLEGEKGDAARAEIVELSKKHAVASRYTSLLVLESEAMFKAFGIDQHQRGPTWSGEEAIASGTAEGSFFQMTTPHTHRAVPPSLPSRPASAPRFSPAPSSECSTPFTIDTNGVKRYKPECFGGPRVERRSDAPVVSPSDPMASSLGHWARRTWYRHGTIAANAVPTTDDAKITAAEEAVAKEPDNRTKLARLVRAYAAVGRLENAMDRVRGWLARDPLDVDALLLASELAARSGDREAELRLLGSIVDVRPDDVRAQLRLARALEAIGARERACGHRIAVAESSPKDIENLGRAVKCSRAFGRGFIGDEIMRVLGDDERRKLEAVSDAAPALRGDVRVAASWEGSTDLDVALVDANGQRHSFTDGSASVTDATSVMRETVAWNNLPAGTYAIEVNATSKSTSSATGTLDVHVVGRTAKIPFTTDGARTVVGVMKITVSAELTPVWDGDPRRGLNPFE